MLTNGPIVLGQYRPLDSYLHHLDARAKIFPALLVLVLALLTDSCAFYLTILAALIGGLLYSGVGLGTLARNFRPIGVLVGITFLYHLIFTGGDTPAVLTVFGVSITKGALSGATFFSLRLILFISVAFLMTLTNSPSELAEALGKILQPLKKLRVPVNDLSLIVFIAMRFIPILFEEFTSIKNAQMMRGVSFSGSIIRRIKTTTAILLPMFVAAIGRADDLALAIEARGYRANRDRTLYSRSRFGSSEWAFAAISAVAICALFYLTREL